jgi:hypothetical protein
MVNTHITPTILTTNKMRGVFHLKLFNSETVVAKVNKISLEKLDNQSFFAIL